MKDLMKLVCECKQELDAIGIEYAKDITFETNSRAKSFWGKCRKHPDGSYTIMISTRLLTDDLKDESPKQTIIHELLHSCEGCMCHTGEWKRLADLVTECYGCYNITRATSASELGVKQLDYKYTLRCSKCGYEYHRNRASNFTRNPSRYGCGNCGTYHTIELL